MKFGTISTTVLTATSNRITVAVPSNITPSAMKISVTVNGQTITATDNFTITN
ncbi:IPT/TIG domain-containing protein [Pedobacter alpinus]|uniref:IPT/TIG domain-containing protein n=1 Tax=Pedobacter alpinus TaxID=1590643 RepID=A0ABW5TT07_9SPHI